MSIHRNRVKKLIGIFSGIPGSDQQRKNAILLDMHRDGLYSRLVAEAQGNILHPSALSAKDALL